MWLTGFDAPSMHTMYVDKPMQGAGLMQAIARVNRTFRDKPGGLIVDYIGVAQNLRRGARRLLADRPGPGRRADRGGGRRHAGEARRGRRHPARTAPGPPIRSLAAGRAPGQLAGASTSCWPTRPQGALPRPGAGAAQGVRACGAREEALAIRDDVRFFADVRAAILKLDVPRPDPTRGDGSGPRLDTAIEQLVSEAVAADEVIDVYAAAGMDRPDLSILSDEFLEGLTKRPSEPASRTPEAAPQRRDPVAAEVERRPGAAVLRHARRGDPPSTRTGR